MTLLAERPAVVDWDTRFLDFMAHLDIVEIPEQMAILNCGCRQVLVAGGEQGGKSNTASMWWLKKYLGEDTDKVRHTPDYIEKGQAKLLYWLVGAAYGETVRELNYIHDWCRKLGLVKRARGLNDGINAYILLKDGTRIESKSATDNRTLSKDAPDGIIGCEASQLDIATYARIRGRITPRKAWMFLAGTFESSIGWYPQLFAAWRSGYDDKQSFSLPSWTNHILYPGGRYDEEILKLEKDSSDDFFMERIAGLPVPPRGLVHSEIRADIHVQEIPYVEGIPVWLGIDPGIAHAYAVEAYQEIDGQEVLIDEIYERDLTTEQVIGIALTRPWWKDVKDGAIDISATARTMTEAGSIADIWARDSGMYLQSNKIPLVTTGIERMKTFTKIDGLTGKPRIVFNPHCTGILSELGVVPSPFDGQTRVYTWKTDREGNVVDDKPLDRHNDAIKATVYFLVAKYGIGAARGNSTKFKSRTAF